MDNKYKLIVEEVDVESFEYLVEQKNNNAEPKYYVKGPFIMMNEKNQNGRIYEDIEMNPSVDTYIEKYVNTKRALNEMSHPDSAEVNLERACDMTTSLVREGNCYIGKAVCLSTPMGKLQESLIRDGVKLGKSTRCLGQLVENKGLNYVKSPKLIATDTVWEPSGQGKENSCFINGILENKEFSISYNQSNEIIYDQFENSLSNLPRRDVDSFITEQILEFINKIK